MSENLKRAGFAVLGLAGGFALGLLVGAGAEDEDRPPIIVKGGSLIFQSGDPDGASDEKAGKSWKQVGGDWQPDHDNGKKTNWFSVAIRGGSGSCPALSMTRELTVTYEAQGLESNFRVTIKPRGPNKGAAPAIVGSGFTEGGNSNNPQLIFGNTGEGSIKRVQFNAQGSGSVTCNGPSSLKIWQF